MQPIQLGFWVSNILRGLFPFIVVVGYVCISLVWLSSILTFFPQVLTTRRQDLPLFFWPPVVRQPLASVDGRHARLWDRICLRDAAGCLPGIHEEWSKHDQEVHETLGQLCPDRVRIIIQTIGHSSCARTLTTLTNCPHWRFFSFWSGIQAMKEPNGPCSPLSSRSTSLWTSTLRNKRRWWELKSVASGTIYYQKYRKSQVRQTHTHTYLPHAYSQTHTHTHTHTCFHTYSELFIVI